MKKLTKKQFTEMILNDYTMFYRPMPEEAKKLFPVVTVDILKSFGLKFTTEHGGKMSGMCSLSTSCKTNPICRKRIEESFRLVVPNFSINTATPEDVKTARKLLKKYIDENPLAENVCICGFCFADRQQDYQKDMVDPFTHNAEILNNGIIHPDYIPVINNLYFRGESFGDFASVNAVINFIHFANRNSAVDLTVWSKNEPFFRVAFKKCGKPSNMRFVKSSPYINRVDVFEIGITDIIFTVVTEAWAKAHGVKINCGSRACLNCLKCYTEKNTCDAFVYEELK